MELLAQVVEEVSILAAEHRRKQPRKVPRPPKHTAEDQSAGYKRAINVLRATVRAA